MASGKVCAKSDRLAEIMAAVQSNEKILLAHRKESQRRRYITSGQREYHAEWVDENRDYVNAKARRDYAQSSVALRTLARRINRPWTSEEDAALMASDGLTLYQKAVALGRTAGSCKYRRSVIRREAADV